MIYTTIMLTQDNQPEIMLEEAHSPSSGQFEPAISWEPGQTINTADYFEQIEDSLVIEVTATARNVAQMEASATRKITLKKNVLDSIIVIAEPDTIEPTEASVIRVVAKDANKNDLVLPGETLVHFTLDGEGASLGKLESPLSSGSAVTATWDEVQSGDVKYIALDEPLPPPAAKVSSASDDVSASVMQANEIRGRAVITATVTHQGVTKSNSDTVVVKEPIVLNITLSETTVRPKRTGDESKSRATVTVIATRGGVPVKDVPIELKVESVPYSGGHDHHDANRPKGKISSTQTQTNTDGKLIATYTASEVSGKENIKVTSSQTTSNATVQITIEVEGLTSLANISSNFWRLVGNTGTTQYKNCPGTEIRHPDSHYGTAFTIENVQSAIFDFFAWSGDTTVGYGKYLVLLVNDMSLKTGGLFDICSTWQQGHTFHRTGASVDFNSSAVEFGNTGNSVNLKDTIVGNTTLLDQLTLFMRKHKGEKFKEEPIHYGFGGK